MVPFAFRLCSVECFYHPGIPITGAIIVTVFMAAMLLVLYLGMAVYQSYNVFAAHKMSTFIVGPRMGELHKYIHRKCVEEEVDGRRK